MNFFSRISGLASLSGLLALVACSGGSTNNPISTGPSTPSNVLASGGASLLYVVQQSSSTSGAVLQFNAGTNGAATPGLTLSSSTLSVQAVAIDSTGQVYSGQGTLGSSSGGQVVVYAAGSSSSTVARTITGTAANPLGVPQSIAVDATGQLYVLTQNGNVLVYSSTASGPSTPVRTITGQATQIVTPLSIAVDNTGNIYVASASIATTGTILVFSSSATGNAAPTRVITSPNIFYGMALDSSQNLYAVLNTIGSQSTSIVEFSSTASGAATPTKTISGSMTGLSTVYGYGLKLDAAGNIWIATATGLYTTPVIYAFNPQATGNFSFGASVASSSWTKLSADLAVK